jgi:hypothetical protein
MPIEVEICCRFFAVEEVERMRRNLFRLSDEQWRRIEPLLPTDVRGKSGSRAAWTSGQGQRCNPIGTVWRDFAAKLR